MGRRRKSEEPSVEALRRAQQVLDESTKRFVARERTRLSSEHQEEVLWFTEQRCDTHGEVRTQEILKRLTEKYEKTTTAAIVAKLLRANGYRIAGRGRSARWVRRR
jgi:hypothetical protein